MTAIFLLLTVTDKKISKKEKLSMSVFVIFIGACLCAIPGYFIYKSHSTQNAVRANLENNCKLIRVDDGGNFDGWSAIYKCPKGEVITKITYEERNELINKLATP